MSELGSEAREALLRIARESVRAAVTGEGEPAPLDGERSGELAEMRGCFVTLKTRGNLRGCLGHFEADAPVAERVNEMARASALEDPRFFSNRIKPEELDDVDIEISVLSPREKVDDPLTIEAGRDGIYVRNGHRSGCYLPQVASEMGWSTEQFISSCCAHKARLPADAWRDPETEVYRFRAQVFGTSHE